MEIITLEHKEFIKVANEMNKKDKLYMSEGEKLLNKIPKFKNFKFKHTYIGTKEKVLDKLIKELKVIDPVTYEVKYFDVPKFVFRLEEMWEEIRDKTINIP